MTVQFISYAYTAHASSGAAYFTELDAMLSAVAGSTSWNKTYSATKRSGDAYLGVLTHTSGAQICFWLDAVNAPFQNPYPNHIVGSPGLDDHLYISIKPSTKATTYDTTKDPYTDTDFCSVAGSTLFHLYTDDLDVNLANRKFLFVADDTDPWLLCEYQEVPGSPGATEAFHAISFEGNGLLLPASIYSSNPYANCFIMSFEDGDLGVANVHNMQTFDSNGTRIDIIRAASLRDGIVTANTGYINDTYDPGADWYQVPIKIAILGETVGVINKDYLCYVNPSGPSNKSKINSGNLQHSQDGMCWYWENAWTVE